MSWMAPFTAEIRPAGSCSLTTLHGGAARGYTGILEFIQGQDSDPTETIPEAPGAYDSCSGSYAAGGTSFETASSLASWPSPEVGVAAWHSPGPSYTGLSLNIHPVVRPYVPSGRSAPGKGVQAYCDLHGCLHHRLGGHVQWVRSVEGVDMPPTALAYQLPRVASSAPCPEPSQRALMRQAHAGLNRQHGDHCIHQPTRWSALRCMSQLARHLLLRR